jgi:hypothetical protein
MEDKIYVIFTDSCDDSAYIIGYIKGTEEEADKWCEEYNAKLKSWENEACYIELKNLKENDVKTQ